MSIKEIKNLYDKTKLIETFNQLNNNSKANKMLIEQLFQPNVSNSNISMLGYTFNPSKTIFQNVNPKEIGEAWNFANKKISLKDFLRPYFIIQTSTECKKELEIKIDKDTYISNTTEPIFN